MPKLAGSIPIWPVWICLFDRPILISSQTSQSCYKANDCLHGLALSSWFKKIMVPTTDHDKSGTAVCTRGCSLPARFESKFVRAALSQNIVGIGLGNFYSIPLRMSSRNVPYATGHIQVSSWALCSLDLMASEVATVHWWFFLIFLWYLPRSFTVLILTCFYGERHKQGGRTPPWVLVQIFLRQSR